MQTMASEVEKPAHLRRRPQRRPAVADPGTTLLPFSPGHLAELDLPPLLRPSLRLFAMGYYRGGPALTVVDNGKVATCAGLMIDGSDATAWAFLSLTLRRQAQQRLYRSFRRTLPKLKRCYGLERILAEAHADHLPSRLWLEHLGFRFDGLAPRCPIRGERMLRYLYP
ncbi:MAG: hypothetical protein ACFCUT_21110 [Kiloniellaceae bacterium]